MRFWVGLIGIAALAIGTAAGEPLCVLYMEATGDGEIFHLKHALEEESDIQVKALFYEQRGNAGSTRNEIVSLDQRNGDKSVAFSIHVTAIRRPSKRFSVTTSLSAATLRKRLFRTNK